MTTGPKLTPHEKLEQAAWKLSGREWSPEYQVITDMALELKNAGNPWDATVGRCAAYVNGYLLAKSASFAVRDGYLSIETENK